VVEFGGYKQRLAPSESTGNSTANRPSPHYPRRNCQRTRQVNFTSCFSWSEVSVWLVWLVAEKKWKGYFLLFVFLFALLVWGFFSVAKFCATGLVGCWKEVKGVIPFVFFYLLVWFENLILKNILRKTVGRTFSYCWQISYCISVTRLIKTIPCSTCCLAILDLH
jgi:hypothetical protein